MSKVYIVVVLIISQEVIFVLLKQYSIKILEQRFKSETDVKVRDRILMMLHLREGYTQREVSSMLHVSVGIVPFWKSRFEKQGFASLEDKEGRGVKPKITEDQLSMLRSAIDEPIKTPDGYSRGWKSKDVRILLKEEFSLSFTRQHICKILHLIQCSLQVPRPRNKSRNQKHVDEFKQEFKKKEKVWIGM